MKGLLALCAASLFASASYAYDNKFVAWNNPHEHEMLVCFTHRMAFGGMGFADLEYKNAFRLAHQPMCENQVKFYRYWCLNHGGEPTYCNALVVQGAQIMLRSATVH